MGYFIHTFLNHISKYAYMSQKNCYYKVTDLNESQIDFCRRKTEENCSVMNDDRTLSPPAK